KTQLAQKCVAKLILDSFTLAAHRGKAQGEDGAAQRIVRDRNRPPVRLHDLLDNRQAEPGTLELRSPSAPKSIEYAFSIAGRNAWSSICYAHDSLWVNPHQHLSFNRRMTNRILNQIPERIGDRMCVSPRAHRSVRSREPDHSLSRQCPGSH